ncbi:helix-turn-helix domain-containing protein [Phytomonospora endophytica]|uniref:DNA-binding transcriptional ArsR family regulator n=1 Tax=Phytomonospora endophytica TaxID=714109 RepID=A0A841FRB0_9ACTN|nr:helix-turn-helix domain-containing protein [Phytomonospora endophytica]MBB6036318.1 DNA-binding transcriptional ArsR family regulator [Phytomonospora endophytica]GIG67225.1 transcriptional regulator [Phytomonospora endophytica]
METPDAWADLVLHPVRIRILRAVATRRRTTRELVEDLPDVPQASLYRHLAALTKGGVLEVAEERKVRGTVERVYVLPGGRVAPADLAGASPEDHLRYFTAFVSTLLSDFSRYVSRGDADLAADGAGYRQIVLHLDDAELAAFATGLNELIVPLLAHGPREGRVARAFTSILLPVEPERN